MFSIACSGGVAILDTKCATSRCEVFDRAKSCWRRVSPMSVPRMMMGCAVLDGEIFVTGGRDTSGPDTPLSAGPSLSHCEKYSPATDTWTRLPDMGVARHGHAAVVLEQVVFVVGGDTDRAEWLDMDNGCWVETAPFPATIWAAGGCVAQL